MEKTILQYQISDWSQLSKCHSNNSPELKIVVSKHIQNDDILGTNICVKHPKYGVLFSYTVDARGDLTSDMENCSDIITYPILLSELRRYGFYIDYVPEYNLPDHQVDLLRTIRGLHFDKIRVCVVHEIDDYSVTTLYITAFDVKFNPDWLNAGYSPSRKEWENAILNGSAMNVSGLGSAKKFNWSWMYNAVFDIDQILDRYDNGE